MKITKFITLLILLLAMFCGMTLLTSCDVDSEPHVEEYVKFKDVEVIKITPVAYDKGVMDCTDVLISYIQGNEYKQMLWNQSRIRIVNDDKVEFMEENGYPYLYISKENLIKLMQ